MTTTVRPFVQKSLEVNQTILGIFNDKLGLPKGTLTDLHPPREHSGSEARLIKNPPMPHNIHKRAIGAHTDFGSLVSGVWQWVSLYWLSYQSFLHNRLGGLQVLPPGSEEWQYVKVRIFHSSESISSHELSRYPDTLFVMLVTLYPYLVAASFTPIFIVSCEPNSITKISTINHWSSPPPGEQSTFERWSLVFFTRPGNSKILRALKESSPIIAAAVASNPDSEFETASTAEDWFARRTKYQRVANRKVCIYSCYYVKKRTLITFIGPRELDGESRNWDWSCCGLSDLYMYFMTSKITFWRSLSRHSPHVQFIINETHKNRHPFSVLSIRSQKDGSLVQKNSTLASCNCPNIDDMLYVPGKWILKHDAT